MAERYPFSATPPLDVGRAPDPPAAIGQQLADDASAVRGGVLQSACQSRLWSATTEVVRGVVLLLHGFTAGPWQFDELGPKLAAAGLDAYAVRLPGHGASVRRNGVAAEDAGGLPRSRQHATFGARAREAYAEALALAQARGVPLYLVGHSAGGAMALDILLRPGCVVARAVLVAPLLRPRRRPDYALVQALSRLPLAGWLSDCVRLSWPEGPRRHDGWVRPGHRRFRLGHVVALFRYARGVQRTAAAAARVGRHLPPIQLICTASDDKVDLSACRRLAALRPKRHHLFCFAKSEGVPHAMLTRYENANDAARTRVHALCQAFFLDGVGEDDAVANAPGPP